MQHRDIPRGMRTSASYDNLGLANPRVHQLRIDPDGPRAPGGRRGSAPFIEYPGSGQNSPRIHRKYEENLLERQYSRSAHNSPLPTRAKLGSRNHSAADLRGLIDEQKMPHSRRGSVDHENAALKPHSGQKMPHSRRGSVDHENAALKPHSGQKMPHSRRGSVDHENAALKPHSGQKMPHSRRGSVDPQNSPLPVRSRHGSRADVSDVVLDNGKSKDKTTPNGVEKTPPPKTSNGDVEKGVTSPPSSPPPTSSPTSPTSPNSPTSSRKCSIRPILKYLCVIVFLVCVAVIIYVIYQQVTKSNKHDTGSRDTTTQSAVSQ